MYNGKGWIDDTALFTISCACQKVQFYKPSTNSTCNGKLKRKILGNSQTV
jgi:hypothetical protein